MAAAPILAGIYDDPEDAKVLEPGTDVEADGNANPPQGGVQDYGPNNEKLEKLKPELVQALRQLMQEYRMEGIVARRAEIRRIKQARLFWQGLQYAWWNPTDSSWHLPYGTSGLGADIGAEDKDLAEGPRFMFVTNLFQAFGLTFISLISQDSPNVRFYPQRASSDQDVTTAKGASDVADLIERNNKLEAMMTSEGFFLWTDGKIGGYVRYVADGARFGYNDQQELAESKMVVEGQEISVPNLTQTRKVPNGQEVITIVGGLELNTPVWANEMYEMPYLQWQREVHIAKLKASYPEAANKIKTDGASESEDIYARTARVALSQGLPTVQPGDALKSLVTFTRTWLRAWAFSTVENVKTREELKALFPDGCYVAFAGDTYCESRNEVMDDHWRVMHAMPGDGQNRPSMGDSLIQINEQYNTMSNIEAENAEYGIPPTYADSKVVDFDALESQTAEPGSLIPISVRTGMTAEAGFFQPAPGQIPAEISQRKQDLMGPVAQFLTGLFPAVFGGEDPNNQTAAGQTLARDQALGRLGLVWRRLKQFHADIMMLGVDCFRKNRSEDVEMAILGEDDEFESKWLRLDDLKGNIEAYPEGDEQIPRMKSQQRAVLQMLMQSDDPYIRAIFTDPNNSSFISGVFGLTELSMPNEDSRIKQQREIAMMMKGQGPIPPQPTMGAQGPMMGQPQTSVPVDPLLDNHVAEMAEIKRWASSGEGVQARQKNAAQFADITLHYQAHAAAMQAQAPPVQPKPPSVTLALKGTDITPEGVAQVAEQEFGVKITPQDVVQAQALDVAKETAIKSSDFGGEQTPRPSGKTGKS